MLALNSTSEDPLLLLLQKKEGASVREWVCVCKLNRGRRKVYGGGWILDEWNVQDPTATWANQLTSTIPAGCQLACFPCECSWYREPAGLIREWVESTVGRRPEKRRGGQWYRGRIHWVVATNYLPLAKSIKSRRPYTFSVRSQEWQAESEAQRRKGSVFIWGAAQLVLSHICWRRAGWEQMDKMNHSSADTEAETIETLRYLR